jgi:ubiquinone/menaquinone biosynthesis C-methylase UbiE
MTVTKPTPRFAPATRRLSPAQALAVTRERLLWNRRAANWDTEGSAGLTKVVEAVVEACRPGSDAVAVDLGCGSGQVTIPLARSCARVLAVDVSAPFIARLQAKASAAGVDNIQFLTEPIEALDLPGGSLDLVVSNYALHHLRDADKARLLGRAYDWLRPGGRLIIGDMMFGRGSDPADRAIISSKARSLLKRGPGGWWRVAKNVWRFTLRLGEKPLPAAKWESLATAAGFDDVKTTRVVAEACVLTATRPEMDERSSAGQRLTQTPPRQAPASAGRTDGPRLGGGGAAAGTPNRSGGRRAGHGTTSPVS